MKKQKIAKSVAQQGDVTMKKLSAMPEGDQKRISKKRCVLAEGEHTGHSHVIEDDEAELIRIGDKMLLKLTKAATVVHEEHKSITLAPGIWEIGQVNEYDYMSKMTRKVVD